METGAREVFSPFHINHTARQAAISDKSPFKCMEGRHVGIHLQEVRELSVSGGFPRGH